MMARPLYIFGILLALSLVTGCNKERIIGRGAVVSETRDIRNFYSVQISGNSNLRITSGNEFKVQVRGYENLLPMYETKVVNGILVMGFRNNVNVSNDNIEVYVTMPSLQSINSSGNSNVSVSGSFVGMDVLSIDKSGNGNISFENGVATNFKLTLSGNSHFKGFGLASENAIITLNGNGDAELTVSKKLNATINGNGNIYYKGNPEVNTQISGNGKVVKK